MGQALDTLTKKAHFLLYGMNSFLPFATFRD